MADTPFRAPAGWTFVPEPPEGVIAVALGPPNPDDTEGFRSNLVLTVTPLEGLSFSDWQNATDDFLPQLLGEYVLIDLERLDGRGRLTGRRLAHHTGAGLRALTMEQWFTVVGDDGHTITATVETARYDDLADTLQFVAMLWWSQL